MHPRNGFTAFPFLFGPLSPSQSGLASAGHSVFQLSKSPAIAKNRVPVSLSNAPLIDVSPSDGLGSQKVSGGTVRYHITSFSHHCIIDLTTAAGEKVIDQPNDQADRPLEDTKAVDAPRHEIAHVHGLTPGYHQIEHMDVHAVAHPSIDAAPERLHSRVEGMDQGRMVDGGLPHDAFRREEMIDPDRLRLLLGGLDLLHTTRAGRAIYLEGAAAHGGPGITLRRVKMFEAPDTRHLLFPTTTDLHKLYLQMPNRR